MGGGGRHHVFIKFPRACVCERPLGGSAATDGGVCVCESVWEFTCVCVSPVTSSPDCEVTTSHARSFTDALHFFFSLILGSNARTTWDFFLAFAFAFLKKNCFISRGGRQHQRIYEKTHVDICHHLKPEGMPIFFVKLTFLLSLIALTRGEWRAGILQGKKKFLYLNRAWNLARKVQFELVAFTWWIK